MTDEIKTQVDKACVILAGAGTGKSYTIKQKAKYLVEELKYNPTDILCLTFSNEATNSLKKGMQEEINSTEDVDVKTFHSFCADILREEGHLVGIDEGFEILLPDDAKIFMHKYLSIKPYWSNRYINTISTAKDFGIDINDIKAHLAKLKENISGDNLEEQATNMKVELKTMHLEENTKELRERKKEIQNFLKAFDNYSRLKDFIQAWDDFDKLKKEKNYLDFSDLNYYTLKLLRQFGDKKDMYKYVFIDEFQDTNKLQFELIEFIAGQNITVVGDPNQSIYGFRGSYKESFEHFMKVFNVEKVFKLDKSWRSPNQILNASHELIKNNYEKPEDCIVIKNAKDIEGDKVKVTELVNKNEEARYIADLVQLKIDEGISKEQICILHRTHKQAEEIKQALNLKNIQYISAGKIDLLQKREIRTVIGYLSILSNLMNRSGTGDQAWWDLFHFQNTLSPEDSVKIGRFLKKNNNYETPIEDQLGIDDLLLNSVSKLDLSEEAQVIIKRIVDKLRELLKFSNKPLPELIMDIYELSGLNRAFSHERTIQNIESLMNLKKFYDLAENYYSLHEKSLTEFIKYLEMVDTLGVSIDASKILHIDAVRLMTIHSSKGLEFDVIISCNLAKDRFPVGRTRNEPLIPKELLPDFKAQIDDWKEEGLDDKEIEKRIKDYDKSIQLFEERRLCYVAWTRAKKELHITYARSYNDEPDSTTKSLFLEEINYEETCEFIKDEEEKSLLIAPNSKYEEYKSMLKDQLLKAMDTENNDGLKKRLTTYLVCRDKTIIEDQILSKEEQQRHLEKCTEDTSGIRFNAADFTFSPTALIDYSECPKKFELSKIYQMPQRGDFDSDGSGASMGSFVHKVLELGVNQKKEDLQGYQDIAKELQKEKDWKDIKIDDALPLIDIFWERNKDKIKPETKTELKLPVEIDGFRFFGLADRVDPLDDGTVEIVDYKTNKDAIPPEKRALQLGFYALALQAKGFNVSKLTLDMLKLDKPIEMKIEGDDVIAVTGCNKTANFKLSELKTKIVTLANSIKENYEHSFECAKDDSPCRFCGYKFYCPKWDE
jgi:DNA helicase II / ATP-dependent DNA helicase PcrA